MAFNNSDTVTLSQLVGPDDQPGPHTYDHEYPIPLTATDIAAQAAELDHYNQRVPTSTRVTAPAPTPTPGFSTSFHEFLRSVVQPPITPASFIKNFEDYIFAKRNSAIKAWVFEIPNNVKRSPVFLECLTALKQAIESTGFRCDFNYSSTIYMVPGTYAIIKPLPHTCQSHCQREGCDIRYKYTSEKDPNAWGIAICF